MTPSELAREARNVLRKAADPLVAQSQRMFFKPWEKVAMHGIKTPDLRAIERRLYHLVRTEWSYAQALRFCDLLIADRYIESKGLGLMLLTRYHRKYEEDLLDRAKLWLERDLCANWAVTDQLSTQILSRLLDQYEHVARRIEGWKRSSNLWVRRAGVVSFVKPSGRGRHLDRVYRVVPAHFKDDHDLMHKACGWLLREAGKADADRLERFLLRQGTAIPRTTVRYAIERFPEGRRRRILERTRVKIEGRGRT